MADTPRPNDKREGEVASDPRWDRKQGTPNDQKTARTVERASSRCSASSRVRKSRSRRAGGKLMVQLGYKLMSEGTDGRPGPRRQARGDRLDFAAISITTFLGSRSRGRRFAGRCSARSRRPPGASA